MECFRSIFSTQQHLSSSAMLGGLDQKRWVIPDGCRLNLNSTSCHMLRLWAHSQNVFRPDPLYHSWYLLHMKQKAVCTIVAESKIVAGHAKSVGSLQGELLVCRVRASCD